MRFKFVLAVFMLFFVSLTVRLFYWQIIKGEELKEDALVQYSGSKVLEAPRGNILANDGTWLAVMRPSWLLFADIPNINDDKDKIAEKLSEIFVEDNFENRDEYRLALLNEKDRLSKLLGREKAVWVPLKNKIDSEKKDKVEALGFKGLGFEQQGTRYYPEGSESAHLLGFVGKDDQGKDIGYFGLEGFYNIALSGKEGYVEREKDLRGSPLLSGGVKEINSIAGTDLTTFIDKRIQKTVDRNLKEGLEKYGAKEGSIIVMDPKTGGILAMSSYPSYDPARYSEYESFLYRNPAISDTFEPGSIFKTVVMAAGIDSGEIKPDTICDICDGPLKVDKYSIETWDKKYYKDSTMTEVLVHSDNVGMSFIALKLGQERMWDYLDKFGIGKLTKIDLQGEQNLPMRKRGTWNIVDLVTSSFGQGIATTPLQVLRAISVIANDGYLVTPKVVNDGKETEKTKVISSEAADLTSEMMKEAAKKGEAKWTDLKGFSIAGKTGTAQIPIAGHYDEDKTIASFVGFAPAEDPKFIMLVTLKEPQSSQWASETAAPLWYAIAKDLFQIFGIQPEN